MTRREEVIRQHSAELWDLLKGWPRGGRERMLLRILEDLLESLDDSYREQQATAVYNLLADAEFDTARRSVAPSTEWKGRLAEFVQRTGREVCRG